MQKFIISSLFIFLSCTTREDRTEEIFRSRLDSLFSAHFLPGQPGGAILLARGDSTVFSKGYGLADLKTKEPITPRTLFNLGSISKTFVANGILILREEGLLSLEDSLLLYFPDFKNKEIGAKVKIRHLLTHTSGLPDNRQVSDDSIFYLKANDQENWFPVTQTDSLIFEPGTQYQYSNPAFNGLALIIEQASGIKWQTFITERIFIPSGMLKSTITDGAHPESGVSHGYVKERGEWREDDYGEEPTFCAAGNGGVWSSVDELFRYEKAMRNAAFMNSRALADSKDVKVFKNWNSKETPFIGWSWFIDKTFVGLKTIGHTGTQGGFYCNYVTVPEKKIFFVMLTNFPSEREQLTQQVLEWLEASNWLEF